MALAKVTSKGQITIPVSIRKRLGLKSGSYVNFDPYGEAYIFNPITIDPLDELKDFFNYTGQVHSVEEMNAAINQKASTLFLEAE